MNTMDLSRTRLYEKAHTFDKYRGRYYHRLHESVRTLLSRIYELLNRVAF